jgi:hypothetical protein
VILSILIPTVIQRAQAFDELWFELTTQRDNNPDVELLFDQDNKEVSIGAKRQRLLERAQGEYVVYVDDDDKVYKHFTSATLKALESKPDCVGYVIDMTTDGRNPQTCIHSLQYPEWSNGPVMTPSYGMAYHRNVTHRNPVKRSIGLQVGFPDLRFGEDKVYSDGVTALCKTEVFIPEPIFHYRYSTAEKHNKKYGIL